MASEFENELMKLINKHSLENESDTPDFLLATYLRDCLRTFGIVVKARDKWYRKEPGGNAK